MLFNLPLHFQYLLFAFSLGSRTLIENVRRVKRASLFYWAPGSREVIVGTLHEMNYDFEEHAGRSLGSNIGNLIELLGSACRDRANYGDMEENVVSLSGGLDSRAVAGGLKRSGIPFQAITYMDYRKTAQRA